MAKTAGWIVSAFSWHVLKVIGGSFISTLTIAVPLFGYLVFYGSISNNVYTFDFNQFANSAPSFDDEFSFIRLKLTYVGLSLIGFTTIIFKILCPREVANYKDEKDYIESAVATTHNEACERLLIEMRISRWYDLALPDRQTLDEIRIVRNRGSSVPTGQTRRERTLRRTDWLELNLDGLNALFSISYRTSNYSLMLIRIVILLGYSIGFIFTLIPSLQIFAPVFMETIAYLRM